MAKILIVHGMRMFERDPRLLHKTWCRSMIAGVRQTAWGKANPQRLPREEDVTVVYWADLFRRRREETGAPKRIVLRDDLLSAYYALLRGTVRAADALALWDEWGEPVGPIALLVNRMVRESALYMQNGPVTNPNPTVPEGAFFQVQARFKAALASDTRIVIGHSLGSTIAYEGLCLHPHRVDTFITVGSPMATPQLIREPMLKRLGQFLNRSGDPSAPWPGVRRWSNFFASADVWSVPIKRLAPIFHPDIVDVEVRHGDPHHFVETHKLASYLVHAELRDEIARALERSWGS
jgi:pimeloyl-ACP methyl ester carboxylesterase